MMNRFAYLAIATLLCGCGAIYSPTLNLPHDPLSKNQGQLTGTLSALPQQGTGGLGAAGSGEGQISYAFSDHLSLQGKAWSQASELYQLRFNGGTSLSATILISDKDAPLPLALIASTSMLVEGKDIKANGGSVQLASWLPEFGIFRPYIAAGAGMMVADFSSQNWGYGGIINAGAAAKLSDHLRLNFEVFGVLQRYIQYHAVAGYLAPSVSISWWFENK